MNKRSSLCLTYQKVKAKLTEFNVEPIKFPQFPIESTELSYYAIYVLSRYSEEYFKDPDSYVSKKLYNDLTTVSQYFDMCEKSKVNEIYNWDFLLSACCAYFLSDNFGSSKVMLNKISYNDLPNEYCEAIFYLLHYTFYERINWTESFIFSDVLNSILSFLSGDLCEKDVIGCLVRHDCKQRDVMSSFYQDIFFSVIKKIIECSSIKILPNISNVDEVLWRTQIKKKYFPKILWQAQRLIGNRGVYSGKSCIIQLPTGVGKTKSIELIIRSAFLANRASIVLIVAPLKALCNEILNDMEKAFKTEAKINRISDAIQTDFVLDFDSDIKNIIICTPEKLNYLFVHYPDALKAIELFIFDEGHLFDDDNRGTEYEFLLTNIIRYANKNSQKILISAVMSNVHDLSNWITNSNDNIINDDAIKTTMKSYSFLSKDNYNLFFFDRNLDHYSYYVPNLLNQINLKKIGREHKQRIFPENALQNSLCIADKLCQKGSVAIYVNQARSIQTISNQLQEAIKHGLKFENLKFVNDADEIKRLLNIIKMHYGSNSSLYFLSSLGLFPHYSNLENGVKIAIEYGVKQGLLNTIICTSTLTQGVNLPIKYLLLSTLKENMKVMSTRSFQNLIGRTARSGMHTEGTIIISETKYYDFRFDKRKPEFYLWKDLSNKFNKDSSEKCSSTILKLVQNFDLNRGIIIENDLVYKYICDNYTDDNLYDKLSTILINQKGYDYKDIIEAFILNIKFILEKIENYLITQLNVNDQDLSVEDICKSTYGYSIATEVEQQKLLNLFNIISNKITAYPNKDNLVKYATAMINISKGEAIYNWYLSNKDLLEEDIVKFINEYQKLFSNIYDFEHKENFNKIIDMWTNTTSYYGMAEMLGEKNIYKIEKLCNKTISYDYSFFIGSLIDICKNDLNTNQINYLKTYQKMIKYGLKNNHEIELYELGLADRMVINLISKYFNDESVDTKQTFINNLDNILKITNELPSVFSKIVNRIAEK